MGAWIEMVMPFVQSHQRLVAPLVGAWIEIYHNWKNKSLHSCRSPRGSVDWNNLRVVIPGINPVAPLVGAWIEIPKFLVYVTPPLCRSPRGSVDWNISWIIRNFIRARRSPRGSVDWNTFSNTLIELKRVAPLVGAWIEIALSILNADANTSLPSWERGLKFSHSYHPYLTQ